MDRFKHTIVSELAIEGGYTVTVPAQPVFISEGSFCIVPGSI